MDNHFRDVVITQVNEELYLATACDSCGAIGEKELDQVKVPPNVVGQYTCRVPLMEILSIGATPISISTAICNEPQPTGEGIIRGIRDELRTIGKSDLPVVISTEKNMITQQTGVGITVTGVCSKQLLRMSASKTDDEVFCMGIPKVGNESKNPDDPEIAKAKYIKPLFDHQGIHDILPIGSRGILKEVQGLAEEIQCQFRIYPNCEIDLYKSAGPSTCVIFTCPSGTLVPMIDHVPITYIGTLKNS